MAKAIDLTGQVFGRLTVIERGTNSSDGKARWLCRCTCGNTTLVTGRLLRNGHTKSCGCLSAELASLNSLNNLIGQRFGKLVVLYRGSDYVSPSGRHLVRWVCKCDCGNSTLVAAHQLTSDKTRSCGCLHMEKLRNGNKKHGGCYDRLYRVFYNMRDRCNNPHNKSYSYYGGRGITICDDWNDYLNFKEWAYSHGYDETAPKGECTLDRINSDGNYEPDNCRWVSMKVQCNNKRNNKQHNA